MSVPLQAEDMPILATRDKLDLDTLFQLIQGEIAAVRIPNFVAIGDCMEASSAALSSRLIDRYVLGDGMPIAGDIKKIGAAAFQYADDLSHFQDYYDKAPVYASEIERIFNGQPPLNRLFSMASRLWRAGCVVEHLHQDDREMYFGLMRIFEKGSYALPHQDVVAWDLPEAPGVASIERQLSCNIYIMCDESERSGGDLVVWDRSYSSKEAYDAKLRGDFYGIDDKYLVDANCLKIHPRMGDLVIFNSQQVHAVTPYHGHCPRITTSCFINYRGDGVPLSFFS